MSKKEKEKEKEKEESGKVLEGSLKKAIFFLLFLLLPIALHG